MRVLRLVGVGAVFPFACEARNYTALMIVLLSG